MPAKTSPKPVTPTLVIDSSIIRKHLFKSWPVLNRIAVVARSGRLNLCIPWLIEQEVLTGLESHVEELTGQENFLKSVRAIASLGNDSQGILSLCDQFEKLRPELCAGARSRFRHWLDMAQAEKPQLAAEYAEKVFRSYFVGDPPFDRPKNREHLPDAFIYQTVIGLSGTGREVWFLGADVQLGESLRRLKTVRVFRDAHQLFAELGMPFSYETEQALGRWLPDFEAVEKVADSCLRSDLPAQNLRDAGDEFPVALKIRDVLNVNTLSIDRQSIMRVDEETCLMAFEADVLVTATERTTDHRGMLERVFELRASIEGHFFAVIKEQSVIDVQLDDFEVGSLERSTAQETVRALPPKPEIAVGYEHEFEKLVKNEQTGVVVVIDSTSRNRRLVAEHIVAAARHGNRMALLGFLPIYERLPNYHLADASLADVLQKARATQPHILGLSNENEEQWTLETVDYLVHRRCLIVATMKTARSRAAVVRHFAKLPSGEFNLRYLLAVAWIQKVSAERITFALTTDSGRGNGSWEELLQ